MGERAGATYRGDVFLVGAGDPTLTSGGLATLENVKVIHYRGPAESTN